MNKGVGFQKEPQPASSSWSDLGDWYSTGYADGHKDGKAEGIIEGRRQMLDPPRTRGERWRDGTLLAIVLSGFLIAVFVLAVSR